MTEELFSMIRIVIRFDTVLLMILSPACYGVRETVGNAANLGKHNLRNHRKAKGDSSDCQRYRVAEGPKFVEEIR
jgi:hypothetical protein